MPRGIYHRQCHFAFKEAKVPSPKTGNRTLRCDLRSHLSGMEASAHTPLFTALKTHPTPPHRQDSLPFPLNNTLSPVPQNRKAKPEAAQRGEFQPLWVANTPTTATTCSRNDCITRRKRSSSPASALGHIFSSCFSPCIRWAHYLIFYSCAGSVGSS